MSASELDSLCAAYTEQFPFHDEDLAMLAWYAERLVGRLNEIECRSLLSLGIGRRVTTARLLAAARERAMRYLLIEGSQAIVDDFLAGAQLPANVEIVRSLFEEYDSADRFQAIEMGFVLEHVADPRLLLERFAQRLEPGGSMFIAVPNAASLHRRIGRAAGLLDDLHRLSEYDLQLGHRRYFDLESLVALVQRAGMKIANVEGIYLKPLTSAQMRSLELGPEVVQALYRVGVEHPALSNALLLEAKH